VKDSNKMRAVTDGNHLAAWFWLDEGITQVQKIKELDGGFQLPSAS
jgi:hypothetical protein